jgi:hypothetical protein
MPGERQPAAVVMDAPVKPCLELERAPLTLVGGCLLQEEAETIRQDDLVVPVLPANRFDSQVALDKLPFGDQPDAQQELQR